MPNDKYAPQRKYIREKVKRVAIYLYPKDADVLLHLQQCDTRGESRNGYILRLIREDMKKGSH